MHDVVTVFYACGVRKFRNDVWGLDVVCLELRCMACGMCVVFPFSVAAMSAACWDTSRLKAIPLSARLLGTYRMQGICLLNPLCLHAKYRAPAVADRGLVFADPITSSEIG